MRVGPHDEISVLIKELSPEPDHAGTLISDFQPPELQEKKFLLFKLPRL